MHRRIREDGTMDLTTRTIGDAVVVAFSKTTSLEGDRSARFKASIRELIDAGHHRIVLDLGEVAFIDSQGLGALISALKTLRGEGGDLKLVNVPEPVDAVLRITKLARVFETHARLDAALGAFV
jgi:anti-sigma B factor antagonist